MPFRWSRKRMIWTIVITAALTTLVVVIGLNFATPSKHLERKIEHRYPVSSAQFLREMSVMLGPSILPGNQITSLPNSAELFSRMHEALRVARDTITFADRKSAVCGKSVSDRVDLYDSTRQQKDN